MKEYLAPGVYINDSQYVMEIFNEVNKSTAGFIGYAKRGNVIGKPTLIKSLTEYYVLYGKAIDSNFKYHHLSYSVEQFFANGGIDCYIMRVASSKDNSASLHFKEFDNFSILAKNPGEWANECKIIINKINTINTTVKDKGNEQNLLTLKLASINGFNQGDLVEITNANTTTYNRITSIQSDEIILEVPLDNSYSNVNDVQINRVSFEIQFILDDYKEKYNVSFNDKATDYITTKTLNSNIIEISIDNNLPIASITLWITNLKLQEKEYTSTLSGGSTILEEDAQIFLGKDNGDDKRSGLLSFTDIEDVRIMSIPGVTIPAVQQALVKHCETKGNRFAILDMPYEYKTVEELINYKENFRSSYAAFYHPWLQYYDTSKNSNEYFPPSASMAGIYNRVDSTRGIHKAPANEVVASCTGLSIKYDDNDSTKTNPKGINLIRFFNGRGMLVWGARTCSEDPSLKYINVQRLLIHTKEIITTNTEWTKLEPNDVILWNKVETAITQFLTKMWREGSLVGATAEESFFIKIGHTTMSADDIENRRLIFTVGIAPTRPSDFLTFTIIQQGIIT